MAMKKRRFGPTRRRKPIEGKAIIQNNRRIPKTARDVRGGEALRPSVNSVTKYSATAASISSLQLPEGFDGDTPSKAAKLIAFQISQQMLNRFRAIPERIGAAIEGGVMLVYQISGRNIEIECDNDLDISVVIDDGSDVVLSEIFSDVSEAINCVESPLTVSS